MTALLIIVSVILLLLLIPVSLCMYYDGRWRIRVSVLFVSVNLPFERKKAKKPVQELQKVRTDNRQLLKQLSELRRVIPVIIKRALATLTVKKLDFIVKVSSDDPCTAAIAYGSINTAVYTTVNLLERYLKIKNKNISVTADWQNDKTEVLFNAKISTYLLKVIICLISLVSDGIIDIGDYINKTKEK